jgi:hypothetical protein
MPITFFDSAMIFNPENNRFIRETQAVFKNMTAKEHRDFDRMNEYEKNVFIAKRKLELFQARDSLTRLGRRPNKSERIAIKQRSNARHGIGSV